MLRMILRSVEPLADIRADRKHRRGLWGIQGQRELSDRRELRDPSGRRKALFVVGLVVALMFMSGSFLGGFPGGTAGVAEAASIKPPAYPPTPLPTPKPTPVTGSWQGLSQLTPGETYTYVLTHDLLRNPQRYPAPTPPAGRPGPHAKPLTVGELNISRVGHRDEIRFWFDVDGVRANGTVSNDLRALAGAVLVTALTGPEPMSADGVRLLASVFQWTQWYDLFATSTFRNGLVWQISQHPPHRLTANLYSGRHQYWAELNRGRDVILELGIDLREPLPWEIIAVDGWNVYRAVLDDGTASAPRR